MVKISSEAKVGLFVLLGVLLLTYMTFTVSGIQWGGEKGYRLFATLDTVAGLEEKAPVKIAGVEVGRVEKIALTDGRARLTLRINPDDKIHSGARVGLKATGLLGDKYLELTPGPVTAAYLKDGDEVQQSEAMADLDKLINQFSGVAEDIKAVSNSLKNSFGTPEGEQSLKETLANLRELSANLNHVVSANDEKFSRTMTNLDQLTANLNETVRDNRAPLTNTLANVEEFSKALKTDGPQLVKSLNSLSQNLETLISDNKTNVKDGLENIKVAAAKAQDAIDSINRLAQKVERGEGTVGKLFTDDKAYNSIASAAEGIDNFIKKQEAFKTIVGFRTEYLAHDSDWKSYFSLELKPKDDKYYLLEIVSDPRGKRKVTDSTTTINGVTTVSQEVSYREQVKISAQFVKRFDNNLALRAGLIESSGGVGLDYYMMNDKVKISAEAFDMNDNFKDKGNKKAHLKGTVQYNFFRNFFISAGYDNPLNSDRNNVFVGAGFTFDDEDLKYILKSVPIPSR